MTVSAGDLLPALEKGSIDAAEFLAPATDLEPGLQKHAPYYYAPGWWEGGSMLLTFVNLQKWNELPKTYQAAVQAAAGYVNVDTQAKYDAKNPAALRSLIGAGAQLRPFSPEIMDAAYKATMELHADVAKGNADFKKVNDSMMAFTKGAYQWFTVAENTYDQYMMRAMRG